MHLIQTRKKLLYVFITIVEHCSDDTISKNSKCLETIEFENALQDGLSILLGAHNYEPGAPCVEYFFF
jgi:hypothetical protein